MAAAAVFAAVVAAVAAASAAASGIQVDVVPNFIGGGVGVTTEWLGARDKVAGIAPGGRAALDGHRFVEVYGPIADINLLDTPNWEFGPVFSYRFGRSDVKDPVVNLLPPIDGGLEAGVFAGWHFIRTQGIPLRLRLGVSFTTAVAGGASGSHVTPYASLWLPLSPTVFIGVGGGLTWSSESFMQQRFGVSQEASAASGLPQYSASAGMRQVYLWPALLVRISREWYVGGGAFWQRITGDGADSPIITQRGERDQITAGIGVGYSW